MTNLARFHAANLPDLMDRITRNSIGMDEYLNRFWDGVDTTSNYPPSVSYTHLTLPTICSV